MSNVKCVRENITRNNRGKEELCKIILGTMLSRMAENG